MKKSELKKLIKEIIKEVLNENCSESSLEEGNRLRALAAAGLLGYAGLRGTNTGQQASNQAQQVWNKSQVGQQAKQIWNQPKVQQALKKVQTSWNQAKTPHHLNPPVQDPNEPLPSEKNMSSWDLANKYTNRNADVAQAGQGFVKKFLPPKS